MTAMTKITSAWPVHQAPGLALPHFAVSNLSAFGLRAALFLAGANTVFTGLNRAFGGIATLGWQGANDFVQVVAEHAYLVQDNHSRFLGGVWTAIGVLLLFAPLDLKRFQPALNFIFAAIFAGGLARLTQIDTGVVFGPDIVVSLVAEIVGMPLLYLWLRSVSADRQ
jgi:hypothetical protein